MFSFLARSDDHTFAQHTERCTQDVVNRLDLVLREVTCSSQSGDRLASLRALVDKAVYLSRTLRIQDVEYKVEIPTFEFQPSIMEDVSSEDDANITSKPVECILVPAIYKAFRQDSSQDAQQWRVLFKARVRVKTE
jgi:activating signal cointegrator complex subunit 1